MDNIQDKMMIKSLINDSLMARSGKQLTGEVIQEICAELLERINEIMEESRCGLK